MKRHEVISKIENIYINEEDIHKRIYSLVDMRRYVHRVLDELIGEEE